MSTPSGSIIKRISFLSPGRNKPKDLHDEVNDDEAEKLKRKHDKVLELHQSSPKRSDIRLSSVSGNSSAGGLTQSQLAEQYENCIKLSAENKITVKNAFALHLIDYMAEMLKKKDSEMINFQAASCTLDASTKIYAFRVDHIHAETFKVASGLSRTKRKSNGGEENSEAENGEDEADDEILSKKKKRQKIKKCRTIETNIKALNTNKLDLQFEVDPLFQKTTAMFADGSATGGVLLRSLYSCDDSCRLILDSSTLLNTGTFDFESRRNAAGLCTEDLDELFGLTSLNNGDVLKSLKICPTFADFKFGSWTRGDSFAEKWNVTLNTPALLDNVDDRDDFAEADEVEQNDDFGDNDADSNDTENLANSSELRDNLRITDVDLKSMLADEPSEYSYFDQKLISTWAGPRHWHVLPKAKEKSKDGTKGPKTIRKKPPFHIDFYIDLDLDSYFKKTKAQVTLTQQTLRSWSEEKITLSSNYDEKKVQDFYKLFLKPSVSVQCQKTMRNEDDNLEVYNYNNENDVDNFCPRSDNDFVNCDEAHSPCPSSYDADPNPPFSQGEEPDIVSGAFTGDNLVAMPVKPAKLDYHFATRAKRINVKRLKMSIWGLLTDTGVSSVEDSVAMEQEKSFLEIYEKLPSLVSQKTKEELSPHIAFTCLLHLANEKCLRLKSQEDLRDFKVMQDRM